LSSKTVAGDGEYIDCLQLRRKGKSDIRRRAMKKTGEKSEGRGWQIGTCAKRGEFFPHEGKGRGDRGQSDPEQEPGRTSHLEPKRRVGDRL